MMTPQRFHYLLFYSLIRQHKQLEIFPDNKIMKRLQYQPLHVKIINHNYVSWPKLHNQLE